MKKEDREIKLFILALSIVLSLGSIKFFSIRKEGISRLLLSFSGGLIFLGLFKPDILRPVFKYWMRIARLVSALLTSIVLIVIFYLVVTPIGLFLRLSGKDLLDLKIGDRDSYWHKKDEVFSKESYLKQF